MTRSRTIVHVAGERTAEDRELILKQDRKEERRTGRGAISGVSQSAARGHMGLKSVLAWVGICRVEFG